MENDNLEFVIDKDRDSDIMDDIRLKLLHCLTKAEKSHIEKYVNFYNNTVVLNFVNENNIIKLDTKEKLLFLKFLDMFHDKDIYISCDKHHNNYMKLLFGEKIFTMLRGSFMYCKHQNVNEEKRKLISNVNSILDSGVGYYDDIQEVDLILNLKNLKHAEIYDVCDVYKILDGICETNYFLYTDKYDSVNLERMKQSNLMKFPYTNNTIASKYYLLESLIENGRKYNMSNLSLKKLLKNIEHSDYFETFSNSTYHKICNIQKKDNLKIKKFKNIEEAISFNIMLSKNGIHGMMIFHHQKYNICYLSSTDFSSQIDLKTTREEYLKLFTKDEIKIYDLGDRTLYYLTNIVKMETGELITMDDKGFLTQKGNIIDIETLENKKLHCYNICNDLLQLKKKSIRFDRSKVNIDVDINIRFDEKIDFIYSLCIKNSDIDVVLEKDIFVDGDVRILEKKVRKMWNRGYFLTDYAIYRYGIMGKLKNQDIKFPDWFMSEDGESYEWLTKTLDSIV